MTIQLSNKQIAALRYEQHKRRLKADFAYFMGCALKKSNPDYELSPAHLLLCDKLQQVGDGKIKKLMALCPSGFGKTTILAHGFACWMLVRQPGIKLIGASHGGKFAENKVSRPIQDLMNEFKDEMGVYPIADNKQEWTTNTRSTYRAAGVGAGILGERAHGGIIDDPFGNIADAKSPAVRDSVYDWYRGDFNSRLYMGDASWRILMHQRLHLDDLASRLLDEEGDEWEVLHLPARFEGLDYKGDKIEVDELGRTKIGESIWPKVWTDEALTQREKDMGPYAWASMYQQHPMPLGGTIFYPSRLVRVECEADLLPAKRRLLSFDFAAAKTKGDWNVACLMQENASPGGWTLLDIRRSQGGPEGLHRMVVDTAADHAKKYGKDGFKIFLPQDPAAAGAYMADSLIKALAGYDVEAARESGDKELRAEPFAAQVNAGNVSYLAGKWNKVFKDELEQFPGGTFDDQVDAASSAFAHLIPEPQQVIEPSWGHYNGMTR
jgi:predicted phage terminase large subunit-like protein